MEHGTLDVRGAGRQCACGHVDRINVLSEEGAVLRVCAQYAMMPIRESFAMR